jgi:hypothetical protein
MYSVAGLLTQPGLSPLHLRVIYPGLDALCQPSSASTGVIFAEDLVASPEQPVDIVQAPATSVDANQGSRAFGSV